MDDLMVHEVIDYNKAFQNAADATKSALSKVLTSILATLTPLLVHSYFGIFVAPVSTSMILPSLNFQQHIKASVFPSW